MKVNDQGIVFPPHYIPYTKELGTGVGLNLNGLFKGMDSGRHCR